MRKVVDGQMLLSLKWWRACAQQKLLSLMSTDANPRGTCALIAPSSGLIHIEWHVTRVSGYLS
jgi:hypothetical protein